MTLCLVHDLQALRWPRQGQGKSKALGVEDQGGHIEDCGDEREEAKVEAQIAWLAAVVMGDAKARAEEELAKV